MPEEDFQSNLLKMIAASAYSGFCLAASRELFGKSYYALGLVEKEACDRTALGQVLTNYREITPALLSNAPQQEAQKQRNLPGFAPAPEKKD